MSATPPPNLDFSNLRLYGRENEIDELKQAYNRSTDSCQIVWLYGYSGTGKSTLSDQALCSNEFYCAGKFDRLRSAQPYSALVTVFTRLCYLLDFDYPPIKVGNEDAAILTRVIPDISEVLQFDKIDKKIVCKQEWGFQKVKQAFINFIKQVCNMLPSPLVIFLDDLQWSDPDTLEVIKAILTDDEIQRGIMFIGCYRDNEIGSSSLLSQCMRSIQQTTSHQISEIKVSNLSRAMLNLLVADSTHMDAVECRPLSDLVYYKTQGNSFFALHMLRYIQAKGLLHFSDNSGKWEWQTEDIERDIQLTSNDVVGLMTLKLQGLPTPIRETLKVASCLGSTFDLELLQSVIHQDEPSVEHVDSSTLLCWLQVAVDEYLIERREEKTQFKFAHDRVQAAAYDLIPAGRERWLLHRYIGKRLQRRGDNVLGCRKTNRSWHFIFSVDQLNRGRNLIESQSERVDLAQQNLKAGELVVSSSSFQLASTFLETGIELLKDGRWEQQYDMTLKLSSILSHVYFSNGATDECLQLIEEVYANARCKEDKYQVQSLQLEVLACTNQVADCADAGFRILAEQDNRKIPRTPSTLQIIMGLIKVKKMLKGKSDWDLLSLPDCTDPTVLATVRNLGFLSFVSVLADNEAVVPILVFRCIELSLKNGISESTPSAFGDFAFILAAIGDIDSAVRFGNLALGLMRRYNEDPRTLVIVHGGLYHLRKPLHDSIDHTLHTYHLAFSQGDLKFAGQACKLHCSTRFIAGLNLKTLAMDCFAFCAQLEKYNVILARVILVALQRSVLELLDRSEEMTSLTPQIYNDEEFESHLTLQIPANGITMAMFWMETMISRCYLGDLVSAHKCVEKCRRSKHFPGTLVGSAHYYAFSGLVALDRWKEKRTRRQWRLFRMCHRKLNDWMTNGNPNAGHLKSLLDAELIVVRKGTTEDVRNAYSKAISLSSRFGFAHDAALTNERAGIYCLAQNDDYWTRYYLTQSKAMFEEWGAHAKVKQMQDKYGELLVNDSSSPLNPNHCVKGRSRQPSIDLVEKRRTTSILDADSRVMSTLVRS